MNIGEKIINYSFDVGIVLKGINGALEIIGGTLLLLISPAKINSLVVFLTQNELAEDPKDLVSNYLLQAAHSFSLNSRIFGFIYLVSHGVIKIILVALLGEHKLWAYPVAIVVFLLFIAYQMYRYSYGHSVWMVVFSVFDILIILFTWLEYRLLERREAVLKAAL